MIVGTAGHIDHGKTSLLKALTGMDADRLPEEKLRGITLDLGFAYQHYNEQKSISFLDVPGHEKLLHNMLVGTHGIDYVLLVVAADDGIMPQTREHLNILDLIGISQGLIALTKIDRVPSERIIEVEKELQHLLKSTTLAKAKIIPCSTTSNVGIQEIRDKLKDASLSFEDPKVRGHFRLAVDRVFTLQGIGLIVTGTVYSGAVNVGDILLHSPSGREIRVRGIHAENKQATHAAQGQRCALNLAGRKIDKDDFRRGDWVLAPDLHAPTRVVDVRLRLLSEDLRPLKDGTPVHIHLAASDIIGRVSLLEEKFVYPGENALARIVLNSPTGALFKDRFIIRDQSARKTLGGGYILDPFPPTRGARLPQRLNFLNLLDTDTPQEALEAVLIGGRLDLDIKEFSRARNLTSEETQSLVDELGLVIVQVGSNNRAISKAEWSALKMDVISILRDILATYPDSAGATFEEILRKYKDPRKKVLSREAIKELLNQGELHRYGHLIRLPGHSISLNEKEHFLWQQIEKTLKGSGLQQLRIEDLSKSLELEQNFIASQLSKFAQAGLLYRVSKSYYMLPEVVFQLIEQARISVQSHPEKLLTVGRYREATKISRHMVMPLMEFFDKIGFTRRIKKGRQLREGWTP